MSKRTNPLIAQRRRRGQRGLNLLEIMISLAIIAMVMGGVAAAIVPMWVQAKVRAAKQQAGEIRNAGIRWRAIKEGDCPTMAQLVQDKAVEATSNNVDDPWGLAYKISCNGDNEIVVSSAGPDKRENTADDIAVPAPPAAKP